MIYKKLDEYILFAFLNKLYSYYDANFNKSIFNNMSKDYIQEYLLPLNYIYSKHNDKKIILKYLNYYHKNNKIYKEEYRLKKISLKTIKLILTNEPNILNNNEEIISKKSLFMLSKAKEFIDVLDKKKYIYSKKKK